MLTDFLTPDEYDELRARNVGQSANRELLAFPDTEYYRFPRVLENRWVILEQRDNGVAYANTLTHVTAAVSVGIELDGNQWLRVSIQNNKQPVTEEIINEVCDTFAWGKRMISVHPQPRRYPLQPPNTIHLFCCLTNPSWLPELDREIPPEYKRLLEIKENI